MESVIEASLKDWREREQRYEKLFSPAVLKSREFLKEKLKHYDQIRANAMANPGTEQRLGIKGLELERRQLARKVYPNVFRRLFERIISNYRIGSNAVKVQQKADHNAEQIRGAMSKAGLGSYFHQVQAQMKQGGREFSLPVSYHVNEHERMQLQLNFKKDEYGAYQMDNYKATLHSDLEKGKPKQHTFNALESEIIDTAKAYNLLAGRAIREEVGNSWKQLDFNDRDANGNFRVKQIPQQYGFDLEKAISALAIVEKDKEALLEKLRNGELVSVTLKLSKKEETVRIAADPVRRQVALHNEAGNKIDLKDITKVNSQQKNTVKVQQLVPKENHKTPQSKAKALKF